jgi:hypothetical protein
MPVDTSSLIGKTIVEILAYPRFEVHPAWVTEATTPVVTTDAFLVFEGGMIARVGPCEVSLDANRYPSLGLEVQACSQEALAFTTPAGKAIMPTRVEELIQFLPLRIQSVVESDPLREGAVSEICVLGQAGRAIILRHIMPPMTLGLTHSGAGI